MNIQKLIKEKFLMYKEINLYDIIVFFMIMTFFIFVAYNMIDSMDEKRIYVSYSIFYIILCYFRLTSSSTKHITS